MTQVQVIAGAVLAAVHADPGLRLAICTLSFGVGLYVMRWWAHREMARIAAERDECWDYANRLLESPEYYAIERGCLDGAEVPRYGLFGRIAEQEPQGDLWTV